MRQLVLLGAGLLLMAGAAPVKAADDDLRASLFAEADQLLAAAREAQAPLLAPRSFQRGLDAYEDAEQRLARGQSLERIRADLAAAAESLRLARSGALEFAPRLAGTLRARAAALSSDAVRHAPVPLAAADERLSKLGADLERGRRRDLERLDEEIAQAYRDTELQAIKSALLADTRKTLERASEMRAERYAPITLSKARDLLEQAEAALESDRYDADRPRALARQADVEARHAIYLVDRVRAVREQEVTLEELLLEWEAVLQKLADEADLAAGFDHGPAPLGTAVGEYLVARKQEIAALKTALSDREQQLEQMEIEIRDLEQRLGGVARERTALEEQLEQRARARQRYQQVEALFTDDEAIVIRDSDKITLRLVGLRFDVGESDISADNYPLLAKVASAIRVFPRARLVVEGHTDAFGSDQKNLVLSEERAAAVRQYLLVSMRLNPGQISAVGHGEEKPIANNETREGRARNRRIELIMFTGEES